MMKQKKIYNYFIFVLLGISLIVPNGFLIVKAEESSNEGAVSEPLSVDSSSVQFENTNVENSSAIEAEKTSVEQQLMESLDETESTITNIPEEHANEDKNDVEQQLTEAVNEEGITNIVIDEKVGAELNTQGPTSTTIQFEEIDDSEKENTITTIISDEPQKETDKDQLEQQLTNAIDETNSVETNIEEENLETTTTTVVENEEKEFNDKDFIDETTIGKIELVKGQILQSMAVLIKKVPKEFGDMLNETTTTTTTVINIQDSMPSASLVEQPEVGVGAGNVQEEETTTTTKEEVLDSTTTTTVEELTTTTETTMTTTTQEENNHEEPTSLFNIIKKFIFRSYVARAVEEETTTTTKEEVLDSTTTTTVEELTTTTETTMTTMPLIETSGSITIELPIVEVSNESKPVLERELWFVNSKYDIRKKIGFNETAPADNFILNYDNFIIWKTFNNSSLIVFDTFEHTFQNFEIPIFDIDNWENQQFSPEGSNFSIILNQEKISLLDANNNEIEIENNKSLKRQLNKKYQLTDFAKESEKIDNINKWKLAYAQSRFEEGKILDTKIQDKYFVMRVSVDDGVEIWYGSFANKEVLATKIVSSDEIDDNSNVVMQDDLILWLSEDRKAMMGYNIRSKNYFGQSFENQYGVNILEIENTKIQFRLLDGDSWEVQIDDIIE